MRNSERNNSRWQLLNEVSSKLQLCGFSPCLVQDLYGSDVTIQATNWFTDGRAPSLVKHALTALSVYILILFADGNMNILCSNYSTMHMNDFLHTSTILIFVLLNACAYIPTGRKPTLNS